jgi:DNA-binding MarR family transcriptional regulator
LSKPSLPFGQTLAFAERTLTATLRAHLAERDITPETWYALQITARLGPELPREKLSKELEGSRTLTPDSIRALLVRLEAEGLIRGESEVALTADGEALHQSLREYIAAPTARLLGQFDADDVETTVLTLQAIAERAAKELAVAS